MELYDGVFFLPISCPLDISFNGLTKHRLSQNHKWVVFQRTDMEDDLFLEFNCPQTCTITITGPQRIPIPNGAKWLVVEKSNS